MYHVKYSLIEVYNHEILATHYNCSIKNGKAHSAILYTKCNHCTLLLAQSA